MRLGSLSQSKRNYSQIEKEDLYIVLKFKKCYQYLVARYFTLMTPQPSLYRLYLVRKKVYHKWPQITFSFGAIFF